MKNLPFIILIASVALVISVSAYILPAQIDPERIKNFIQTYSANYGPEKVYIHQDKSQYLPGETLWLAAYIVDAASLLPTQKSGVLYVDLVTKTNQPVKSLTLPIEEGAAFGDILLPDDLSSGEYLLSAHTHWQKNFGEAYFFQREISIISPSDTVPTREVDIQSEIDVRFFPEGGELIEGISQVVAFKATDQQGKGVSIQGSLVDGEGNEILTFSDVHEGTGSFTVQPAANSQLYAKIPGLNGEMFEYSLPKALPKGYAMEVDEVSNSDSVKIAIRTNVSEVPKIWMVIMNTDTLIHAESFPVSADEDYYHSLSKSQFPAGISRITLASENGEPLAERLIFKKPHANHEITISAEKPSYGTREKVDLSVQFSAVGSDTPAKLSMAVIAEELVPYHSDQENILTYLLLSSELKGSVHSPGYYFESDDREHQEALRLLMMTQGWRTFEWNDVVESKYPAIRFAQEQDLTLWGRLTRSNGEPVSDGETLLYLKDQYQTFITTATNADGYFGFQGFYFTDTIQVVVQGSDSRGNRSDVEISMLSRQDPPPRSSHVLRPNLALLPPLSSEYFQTAFEERFQATESAIAGMDLREVLLQEVVIEGRAEIIEPFRLHSRADVTLNREQLPVAPSGNILESLQGRVAGLQISRTGMNEFRAVIRGQGTPLYLLDGMPISEGAMQSINQFDISRIEILKGPGAAGIYGGRAGGGVIAFFTHRGGESEEVDPERGKHIMTHLAGGYTKTRRFYSPTYEESNSEYFDYPDWRSTIYWEPNIRLNAGTRRTLSFYTADTPGKYRVTVEGISTDGQPLFQTHSFIVED
ncbi:MAG TPA: TonB-dependent receptor plug domain-containing protein [Lunatimonas sp.]|nr:TonB-dependent receptor plug domain-containing protein [Lunatimonas sp.]